MGWRALDSARYGGSENYFPGAIATTRAGAIIILGGPPGVNRDSARVVLANLRLRRISVDCSRRRAGIQQSAGGCRSAGRNVYMSQSWESWLSSPLCTCAT